MYVGFYGLGPCGPSASSSWGLGHRPGPSSSHHGIAAVELSELDIACLLVDGKTTREAVAWLAAAALARALELSVVECRRMRWPCMGKSARGR
jgi:hypothetical protein